ncbi:hypothetical protein PAPYR_2617 [Paratrimastix pyriformis]|uniref:Uncharacterized protein n=1 Tax=Paratrimastix pyriformis TaxID=342808 RepID=A0ABQ8UPQ8_9EUKA|nr:hypothetical protein PAPYR_2617 [Paratrimastix pyriformis]
MPTVRSVPLPHHVTICLDFVIDCCISYALPKPVHRHPVPPRALPRPAVPPAPRASPGHFSGESDYERLLGQLALSAAQPAAQQKLEPRHKRPSQQKSTA